MIYISLVYLSHLNHVTSRRTSFIQQEQPVRVKVLHLYVSLVARLLVRVRDRLLALLLVERQSTPSWETVRD